MKQFILSVFIAWLYFLSTFFTGYLSCVMTTAQTQTQLSALSGSYACILEKNSYLYASSNERSGLFLLPQSYYVKTLDVQAEFTKVEYSTDSEDTKKITGYCKTSQLTFVDYIPTQPYFHSTFELTYRIDDSDKQYPFLTEITVTCSYYGEYPIGSETYCYVLRDDSFGYVPKPDDFTVPTNTEYADRLTAEPSPEESNPAPQEESLPLSQIVTILLLCLLAPILATLILRPNRKHPTYDEE